VSSATAMILYGSGIDVAMSVLVMGALFGYLGVYAYRAAVSGRFVGVERQIPPMEQLSRRTPMQRTVQFLLAPSHDVTLMAAGEEAGEVWLRQNFYFVTERRWVFFGVIEVIGGTITNMLEGIPLTTRNQGFCIARPACMLAISVILLLFLLLKKPNAVRLQQWCSLVVMGGLVLASGLVTVHAVAPSEKVGQAAGYIGVGAVGVSMLLGLVDIATLALIHIPSLSRLFAFSPRGPDATIKRSAKEGCDDGAGMLRVPMLPMTTATVVPKPPPVQALSTTTPQGTTPINTPREPPTPPNTTPNSQAHDEESVSNSSDDLFVQRIIANVDELDRREKRDREKDQQGYENESLS
jgi:hypothetical protein